MPVFDDQDGLALEYDDRVYAVSRPDHDDESGKKRVRLAEYGTKPEAEAFRDGLQFAHFDPYA